MDILKFFVYGLISIDLINGENLIKIGMCENYKNRKSTYITGYPYNSPTLKFVILCETKDVANDIEFLLHCELYDDSTTQEEIYNDGGTEWFNIEDFNIDIIRNILQNEGYTNKILIDNELIEFEENEKRKDRKYKQKKINQIKISRKNKNIKVKNAFINFKNNKNESNKTRWNEREYQKDIIIDGYNKLLELSKFCLELATGGGKTYIVYKILSMILSDVIIIFSPRKKINTQNVDKKYLSLLNNQYEIFNCSTDKNFEEFKNKCQQENKKIIIIGCPQSKAKENIYEIIHNYDLNNILIWYDEFHHTIENWINTLEDNRHNKFYLQDNNKIKYRIFTSASPDKNKVKENTNIFGELHSPIKVKDLISQGWLCPLIPYIFNLDNNDVNICKYNLNNFYNLECNFGFSFHNKRDSAYTLFYEHYKNYKINETNIKPYLLVSDDYKIKDDIILDYDFKNIQSFQDNPNSIAYVVQLYTMGYDFNKIDYQIFSDHKLSYSDIIQSIGRGLRSDCKGHNGLNLKKKLHILLPIYIDKDIINKYNRIELVMRFICYDIDYPFNNIVMNFTNNNNNNNNNNNILNNNYLGNDNMKAILFDLMTREKYSSWEYYDFIHLLKKNNIHNRETDYNNFIENRPELKLPKNPYTCFPNFNWEQTYIESPYYSKIECKKAIFKIKNEYEINDFDDIYNPEIYLNNIDCKIPPVCLFRFYGGFNNNEYY